ncbi:MFS transporter [Amycolatopsis sulphurea]|uniref:MFS transporter n=1 Tax=Amycolatopsis sulphurea TaxID=76022 RepID=UPI000BF840A0|nr:MFS transporter [Amycolatopsis sulphurea]
MPPSSAIRRYLFGYFVTNVGVGGFTLAVGLILFARTGSAEMFGILVGMEFGLGLIGQVIGVSVLDRRDALKVAIIANVVRGCAVLGCGALLLATAGTTVLTSVFLVSAIIRPLYRAASFALVVRVCEPVELARVNGLRFGLLQVAQVTGLLWVSLLNAVAPQPVMLLGVAACLLAGTAILAGLRHLPAKEPPDTADRMFGRWRELGAAFRRTPAVAVHLLLGCAGPLAVALAAVLVAPVNAELGGGALGIIALDGSAAAGSFVAVMITRKFAVERLPSLIWAAPPLMAAGLLLLGLNQSVPAGVVAFLGLGCGSVLSATALDSLLQYRTAARLVGRLAISQEAAVSLFALVALPVFGRLLAERGVGVASVVFATVLAGFTVAFAVGWSVRRTRLLTSPVGIPDRIEGRT